MDGIDMARATQNDTVAHEAEPRLGFFFGARNALLISLAAWALIHALVQVAGAGAAALAVALAFAALCGWARGWRLPRLAFRADGPAPR